MSDWRFESMRVEDLGLMDATEPGVREVISAGRRHAEDLAKGAAYTAWRDGKPVASAGLLPIHAHRALAWAVIGSCSPMMFLRVHREITRRLARFPFKRVEAAARIDFIPGQRWLQIMGFRCEVVCAEAYMPDGSDASLYALVRS